MPECFARYGMTEAGQWNDEYSSMDIAVEYLYTDGDGRSENTV